CPAPAAFGSEARRVRLALSANGATSALRPPAIVCPMASAAPQLTAATVTDLLAIPEPERFHEIIDGELLRKAMPSIRHGMAQMGIGDAITGPYGPRARERGPGGWVFASETEILFDPSQVYRPDVAGWRRER